MLKKLWSILIARSSFCVVFKLVGAESTRSDLAFERFVLVAYEDKFTLVVLVVVFIYYGSISIHLGW